MRVAVVDTFFSAAALDGGSRSIVDLVRSARELGHDVELMTDLDAFGRRAESGDRWDVVVVSRPDAAVRLAGLARRASDRVVHLGMDLHHVRLSREAEHGSLSPGVARAHLALERQAWLRCDVSAYPDRAEVTVVDEAVGPGRAVWFPYFRVDDTAEVVPRSPGAPLVFLGGAGHLPNVTGLRWYVDEVVPRLGQHVPHVEVIGEWPNDARPRGAAETMTFLGPLSPAALTERLASASAMIVPLRTGAGLKSKVIDALAAAVPLVTTAVGMGGVEALEPVAWVADAADEWVDLVARVRSGHREVAARAAAGTAYVESVHGRTAYLDALERLLHG